MRSSQDSRLLVTWYRSPSISTSAARVLDQDFHYRLLANHSIHLPASLAVVGAQFVSSGARQLSSKRPTPPLRRRTKPGTNALLTNSKGLSVPYLLAVASASPQHPLRADGSGSAARTEAEFKGRTLRARGQWTFLPRAGGASGKPFASRSSLRKSSYASVVRFAGIAPTIARFIMHNRSAEVILRNPTSRGLRLPLPSSHWTRPTANAAKSPNCRNGHSWDRRNSIRPPRKQCAHP
jgi:hypothetical protein